MRRAFWCVADKNNLPYFAMLKNSLKKFDDKTDFFLFNDDDIKAANDPHIFYRATPYFTKALMDQGYTEVCKLDADQIILGNLDHIWEGDYSVAVVNNSNPREMAKQQVSIWDIHPLSYVNCGFVVMKDPKFVEHWLKLCYSPHFESYQMREQDLLNILVFYSNQELGGPYKVRFLDDSTKWHGLISKQFTAEFAKIDEAKKIILAKNTEWNIEDKELVAYHFAGGNNAPDKGKYNLVFNEEITKYIDTLVKP